jgi:hypothetical protein
MQTLLRYHKVMCRRLRLDGQPAALGHQGNKSKLEINISELSSVTHGSR